MNRKDFHHSAEGDWRASKQPTLKQRPIKPEPKGLKVMSVLKAIAVVIVLVVLWDQYQHCSAMLGNSPICLD